jgi:chemotaxis protein MotB
MIPLSLLLLSGCGVSKSKYMDVTKSRDELAAQNQSLKASVDSLNQTNTQLAADKAALDGKVKEMDASSQQMAAELEVQRKASEESKKAYEDMIGHLQGEVSSGKVEVQQMKEGVSVNLAQDILFPSGSAELDKKGREILLKVTDVLKDSPYQVIVSGHTDNQKIGAGLAGRYPSNWELGSARASRIVRLFQEAGVPKEKLAAVSFADSRPRMPNNTPDGRAKNRRIEIRLRPAPNEQTAGAADSTR